MNISNETTVKFYYEEVEELLPEWPGWVYEIRGRGVWESMPFPSLKDAIDDFVIKYLESPKVEP